MTDKAEHHPCDIANLPECMGIPCEGYMLLGAAKAEAEERTKALSARLAEVEAERDKLRVALERIDEASNHYALTSTYSEGTLRYAHESTKRLARAALSTDAQERDDDLPTAEDVRGILRPGGTP